MLVTNDYAMNDFDIFEIPNYSTYFTTGCPYTLKINIEITTLPLLDRISIKYCVIKSTHVHIQSTILKQRENFENSLFS